VGHARHGPTGGWSWPHRAFVSAYAYIIYPITFILSPFLVNHIISCLEFCVDMVSNLDPVSMIFTLSSITTLPHQQNT